MKKLIIPISVALIVTTTIGLIALEADHYLTYGDFFPLGLHADLNDFESDIASGTVTFFDAHLTNLGLYPQEIEGCEFASDANAHEVSVAYRVESYDYATHHWKTAFDNKQNFCRPCPLGIAQAKLVRKTLWSAQNGDTIRFVIEANGREFPSGSFSVIEAYRH